MPETFKVKELKKTIRYISARQFDTQYFFLKKAYVAVIKDLSILLKEWENDK